MPALLLKLNPQVSLCRLLFSLRGAAVWYLHPPAWCLQAMEPFFSVLLSAIFLGDAPTLPVVMTLFPIVGGVAMASISEATFNWPGFIAAMGSNVTFQSRNVFSKKFMGKGKVGSACTWPLHGLAVRTEF